MPFRSQFWRKTNSTRYDGFEPSHLRSLFVSFSVSIGMLSVLFRKRLNATSLVMIELTDVHQARQRVKFHSGKYQTILPPVCLSVYRTSPLTSYLCTRLCLCAVTSVKGRVFPVTEKTHRNKLCSAKMRV